METIKTLWEQKTIKKPIYRRKETSDEHLRIIVTAPTNNMCDELILALKNKIPDLPAIRLFKDVYIGENNAIAPHSLLNIACKRAGIDPVAYQEL